MNTKITEDPTERARKYIASFEKTLPSFVPVNQDAVVKAKNIKRISDTAQRYLTDARFYLENNKPTTSLASIAYAEGLLDALTFLKFAEPHSTTPTNP